MIYNQSNLTKKADPRQILQFISFFSAWLIFVHFVCGFQLLAQKIGQLFVGHSIVPSKLPEPTAHTLRLEYGLSARLWSPWWSAQSNCQSHSVDFRWIYDCLPAFFHSVWHDLINPDRQKFAYENRISKSHRITTTTIALPFYWIPNSLEITWRIHNSTYFRSSLCVFSINSLPYRSSSCSKHDYSKPEKQSNQSCSKTFVDSKTNKRKLLFIFLPDFFSLRFVLIACLISQHHRNHLLFTRLHVQDDPLAFRFALHLFKYLIDTHFTRMIHSHSVRRHLFVFKYLSGITSAKSIDRFE